MVNPTNGGHLKVYSGAEPGTSTLNFGPGQTRANNALVPLMDGVLFVKPFIVGSGTTDVIIDVNGYTDLVPN